jgi:Ca-activated chloride channel family protein
LTKIPFGSPRLGFLSFTAFSIVLLIIPWSGKVQDSTAPTASQNANSGEIRLSVSVRDETGRVAANLSKDAFTVLDGKSLREINFFEERDEPYSIGFLLDASGSMLNADKHLFTLIRDNILRFLAQSNKANEYFFLTFAGHPQLLMEWTRDVVTAGDALDKLALGRQKGPTALFDACLLGIEKLRQRPNPRRALILLTDGQDNVSNHSNTALSKLVEQSDVVIYAVYKADLISGTLAGYGKAILRELTSISGGALFAPVTKTEMTQAFDSIAAEMQHQYIIGFNPASLDGKWHSIKVKVAPIETQQDTSKPNKPRRPITLSARTRPGFYAPKSLR